MLASADVIAFVATRDPAAARTFYAEILGPLPHQGPLPLGLRLVADDQFALVSDANGTETYEWLPQDQSGVWTAPDGTKVAWFKDPDGNLLSLTQFRDRARTQ